MFEFIGELSGQEKAALLEDKAVCLCLFRHGFTSLEQQLLYKLLFLDPEGPTFIDQLDIKNALTN
jgi:hypothetical protein